VDWELARHELLNREHQWFHLFDVWISWQNHSFDCVSDIHERSFQNPLAETLGSCKYIHGVEVAFMLFFCRIEAETILHSKT